MNHSINFLIVFLFFSVAPLGLKAQDTTTATISGTVISDQDTPLPGAYIFINSVKNGVYTDSDGKYSTKVPANTLLRVFVVYIGYDTSFTEITLKPNEQKNLHFQLNFGAKQMTAFTINARGNREEETGLSPISSKGATQIANPSSSIEKTLIFQGQGVSSRNELSSQYSVRGGNFDENLIYVNGVQIYRPFLVRSGRQEGLSFVNPSLVSNVNFSSGGFESRYGDKMSSVLDVTYKEPEKFAGFLELSFLGAQLALEQASDDRKFTQIHGFRYRTNQYLLKGLDTQGDYQPEFIDYQGYFTYDLSDRPGMML